MSGDSQAELALADLNQAIELGPPRAEIYNNRGVVHVSRGELDQAIADFDEAIRIYPEFAWPMPIEPSRLRGWST